MAINTSPHSGTINPPPIRDCKTFSSCMCVLSCFVLFCLHKFTHFILNLTHFALALRDRPKWRPKGVQAPLGPKTKKFSYNIFHFCSQVPFLHNKPNQSHSNSNYLTKKLNKNNKNIHNSDCILAQKKKKLFYHQKTKK